jgi:outer membrane protein assembly factor BamD
MEDYLNAENLFKGFLDVFPKSTKAAEIDYMRAYSYYKQSPGVELDQTATHKTVGLLQAHINNYPESPKVSTANEIIERHTGYANVTPNLKVSNDCSES